MRRIAALGAILALLAACSSGRGFAVLDIRTGTGSVRMRVEIASTPADRAQGLMGRDILPADQGMAFLWNAPVQESFWMKDTTIPLSIAFWDRRDRIVAMLDMAPCRADPCPTYDAGVPYVGAVEANRGFFADHGVGVGDRVTLSASE